ncbi:MAG: hypothetical protein MZU84_02635 [Sphingobacterium sp.]|nr:hypothetical protein [Sphingobacterium sp.]
MTLKESEIEQRLIKKLEELKYTYRPDIRDTGHAGAELPRTSSKRSTV